MMATEDRTAVLRALAAREISVVDAEDRLAALEDDAVAVGSTPLDPSPGRRGRRAARRSDRLPVDDIIALASHGVDASYLRALRESGFGDLETQDIIRLADHGAETAWLRAIRDAGIEADIDDLVKMVDHGVEVEWLQEIRRIGFAADADDLVRLADHGVEAEWLASVPASVLSDLDIDELISLADHGVEPDDLQAYLDLRADDPE